MAPIHTFLAAMRDAERRFQRASEVDRKQMKNYDAFMTDQLDRAIFNYQRERTLQTKFNKGKA